VVEARETFRTKAISGPRQSQDHFLSLRTELREFHAAEEQKNNLPNAIALMENCLAARIGSLLSRGHHSGAVLGRHFPKQLKTTNHLGSQFDNGIEVRASDLPGNSRFIHRSFHCYPPGDLGSPPNLQNEQ
jgi:hypothetical protein